MSSVKTPANRPNAVDARAATLVDHVRSQEEQLTAALAELGLRDVGVTLAVWDYDFAKEDGYVSSALRAMLGESPSEKPHSPKALIERIHPEDRGSLGALFVARAEADGSADVTRFSTVLRVRDASDHWRWLSCTGCAFRGERRGQTAGSLRGQAASLPQAGRIVLLCEDHTEAYASREELSYARDFGEKVVRSTVNGILGFDTELNIIEVNPALEQMFGVTRMMAVGRNVFEVLPFLRESHEDCFYSDTLAGKKQASYDRPYWRIDTGEEGFFRANYIPLRERGRDVTGGLVVVAETTFDRQNQRLQNILLEAGTKLAQSHEPRVVLDVLLQLAVPGLCDWSVVYLSDEQSFFVRHSDSALQRRLEHLLSRPSASLRTFLCSPPMQADKEHVGTEALVEVPTSLFRLLCRNEEVGEVLGAVGIKSYFRVALTSQGHTLGTMTFVKSHEPISEQSRAVSELVALRGALALANASLLERSRAAERVLARIEREVLTPLGQYTTVPSLGTAPGQKLMHVASHLSRLLAQSGT